MIRVLAFERGAISVAPVIGVFLVIPPIVVAHGSAPVPASWTDVLFAWSLEAHVLLPLVGAWLIYRWAARAVSRGHPTAPWPRWRYWAWIGGLLTILISLASPIGTYDTTLFWVHMVQHLALVMVAAPLLALGAPITLILRVSSAQTRRRLWLPILHSRPIRALAFPVVSWALFAAVMWASHFSPMFDASLDNDYIHLSEHALYLGSALLFWWPVVGADPSPWRLPHPARVAYLFLGMPQSSFLGLAIFSAPAVLYPHYETLVRPWGPSPLVDQQWAGGIMWAGGDAFFLVAMILALWVWLRAEERAGRLADERLDREESLHTHPAAPPAAYTGEE